MLSRTVWPRPSRNYALDQIDELTAATGVTPSVNQIRRSPALYDRGVASGLEQRGVALEGYGPLKRSNLDDPTLVSIAGEHEATTAQVIVAWHVAHGFVVIRNRCGRNGSWPTLPGHVKLTPEEVTAIDRLSGVAMD